jgi:uncharacterized membrane protein YkvA (DUF1232 family)
MDAFFEFLKYFFIGIFALIALFLILLALPKSRLRNLILEITGWGTAATATASVISPIDPVPDFIPLLGQMDDLGMIVLGICSAILAAYLRRQRKQQVQP